MNIETKGTALRLRWRHEGKRYCLGLGVKNNPAGKAFANQKKALIEMDIISGYFDPTLLKYKPRKLGANPSEITAVALFEKYMVSKDKELAPGSIGRYRATKSKLQKVLGNKLAHQVNESIAKSAIRVMNQTLKGSTVVTYLYLIQACWNWAKDKYHLADINPWDDCLSLVKVEPRIPDKHFTIAELQAIVKGFSSHPQYCHYTEFVMFLAHTACRFGEAAGLRWKHLGTDFSTAWIGKSISRGNEKSTKTNKDRIIQLSPTLKSILLSRYEQVNPSQTDLVFPSPKGFAINDHNFLPRAWKKVLSNCNIEYRRPYNLRHSAITHALERGANPIALAKQTGHSVKVLLSTYDHVINKKYLLVDFSDLDQQITDFI
jgi:integrase